MNILIIGAGKSGRGFIPQFIHSKDSITFLDIDEQLIKKLKEKKKYTIYFYGSAKEETIHYKEALNFSEVKSFGDYDLICISIKESNYNSLIEILKNYDEVLPSIIMFENGINPKEKFKKLIEEAQIKTKGISQAAIFTTTNNKEENDIISEDYQKLYYDGPSLSIDNPFLYSESVDDFEVLMKRKIYTYNLLSAVFGYAGYDYGYTYLSEVYDEKEFKVFLNSFKVQLDSVYAKAFDLSIDEQIAFSNQAIKKFSSKELKDSIHRNCQDVKRKLSLHERLHGPLEIFKEHHADTQDLLTILALMINYGIKEEGLCMKDLEVLRVLDESERVFVYNELEELKKRSETV